MATADPGTLIDFEHLELYTGGDVALTREVLQLFRTQCAQLLEALKASGDLAAAKQAAHGIKGACRSIGAWNAARLAEAVEATLGGHAAERQQAIRALGEILPKVWETALSYETGSQSGA